MTESNERLDLEESHTPGDARIRRIKLPHTISDVVRDLMYSDHILAPARDLIGPDIRLHTSKLNMKSANFGAAIEWHQDFAFYPHSNDDVLAIGVIIDDMRSENGPLMVFPGSHKGPIHDHHVDGIFAGPWIWKPAGLALTMRSNWPVRRFDLDPSRPHRPRLGAQHIPAGQAYSVLRNDGGRRVPDNGLDDPLRWYRRVQQPHVVRDTDPATETCQCARPNSSTAT